MKFLKSECRFGFLLTAMIVLIQAVGVSNASDRLGRISPNSGLFPDSSLVNFSFLLSPPAGKNGFLRVGSDGHFHWSNGRRAKFWGVNVSSQSVFCSKAEIDKVTRVFARAGVNMVRFEALDSYGGLLDVPGKDDSRHLDPAKLDLLDYWTSRLRALGIYYYFDLIDFRTFKKGDDVPAWRKLGRAAKPEVFFDPRLIKLQEEYARELLLHKNPYTGLRYADDPALALLEVCNESGMFMNADTLDNLPEPYETELNKLWSEWLLKKYLNRPALKTAWGMMGADTVLQDQEDPSKGSVMLGLLTPAPPSDSNVTDVRRAPTRIADTVRFLFDLQRDYCREMKDYLRGIGVKIPITAVVSSDIVPDVASVAQVMDFTAENYYADHPQFADGDDWKGKFYYNDTNPLRGSSIYQIMPWVSALRWENKPVVVREYATVWPNRYRCISIPEMAAYADFQDLDAVLLFGYRTTDKPDILQDFANQCDPTVWGLFGMGAYAFLRNSFLPAPDDVTIHYNDSDLFQWPDTINSQLRLAWFAKVNNTAGDAILSEPHKPFLVVPRSENGDIAPVLAKLQKMGVRVNPYMAQAPILRTPTRQIIRNTKTGTLTFASSTVAGVCGELPVGKPVFAGPFALISQSHIATFMAVSLDGLPLAQSKRYVLKMVTRAENTDQKLSPSPPGSPGKLFIADWGRPPVVTLGRKSASPLILKRNGKTILSLNLTDGYWEIAVRDGVVNFACDKEGIPLAMFGKRFITAQAPISVDFSKESNTAMSR
jgi:hypothetical protein